MAKAQEPWRQYLVVNWQAIEKPEALQSVFGEEPRTEFNSILFQSLLAKLLDFPGDRFEVLRPAVWPPALQHEQEGDAGHAPPARITIPFAFQTLEDVQGFADAFQSYKNRHPETPLLTIAANPAINAADYCCPRDQSGVQMGKRTHALSLIRLDALLASLTPQQRAQIDGHDVNVVLVDEGIDENSVPPLQRGSGWPVAGAAYPPWKTPPWQARHSTMMVRNILSIAPKARLFDLPLIQQPKYGDIVKFIDAAHAMFELAFADIRNWQKAGTFPGPWILVNAWAPFDLRREFPRGDYSNNPLNHFHLLINDIVAAGIDVVFCAGNCGDFCPDGRCGPNDIGPGRSILGAASHPRVTSVGAVRVDGMWIGYSSQGPGQSNLSTDKPDLCAPSGFAEDHDRFAGNIGTSAACAVAAGALAALRGRWPPSAVQPDSMRSYLRQTAHSKPGPLANRQFGAGILDIKAAYEKIRQNHP